MTTIEATDTNHLCRESDDDGTREFFALLFHVPESDRQEVFADLAAICGRPISVADRKAARDIPGKVATNVNDLVSIQFAEAIPELATIIGRRATR